MVLVKYKTINKTINKTMNKTMNKIELANIIVEAIKDKVTISNVVYQPNGDEMDIMKLNPVIPVLIETEHGIRKAFSITISE